MTAPDPANITAPIDPAAYGGRPRLFTATFWALIAFAVLCVIAGYAIAKLGPQLFPIRQPAAPAASSASAPAASLEARVADIQSRLAAEEARPADAQAAAPSVEISALSARVDRLETDRGRLARAAAGALAAATLSEASSGSRPFVVELAAVEASLPDSAALRALRPLAETGAPTQAALAVEFGDTAARAAVASRARARGEGLFARIAQAFAAILTIRRVDQTEGKGVDAVLARAGHRIDEGDLSGALGELSALPPAGQDAIAGWRARAEKRVEIDRRVGAIRAQSLAELTRVAGEGQTR
jgi:hypothetical protein